MLTVMGNNICMCRSCLLESFRISCSFFAYECRDKWELDYITPELTGRWYNKKLSYTPCIRLKDQIK